MPSCEISQKCLSEQIGNNSEQLLSSVFLSSCHPQTFMTIDGMSFLPLFRNFFFKFSFSEGSLCLDDTENIWSMMQPLASPSDKQMAEHASGSAGISPHSESFNHNSASCSKTSYVTPTFCTNWVMWNVLPSLLGALLLSCQPQDNAGSEEPCAPAGAQLAWAWTEAKWLLKRFPWATAERISPAAFMPFLLVEGRLAWKLLECLQSSLEVGEGEALPGELAPQCFQWR